MPVPTSMQDLSAAAASNSPQGSENVAPNLDNYLRSHAAIIRQTYSMASSSIASASTVDVAAADGESVQVTGSSTINSLGTGFAGCLRELRFSGAATLAASANIQGLPGSANITVAAGETMTFRCIAPGQWRLVSSSRLGESLGFTPVNKAGDTMTGALIFANDINEYIASSRAGYAYHWANLGNGGHALWDAANTRNAWVYNGASGGSNDFAGTLHESGSRVWTAATLNPANYSGTFNATNVTVSGNQVWHAGNSARVIVSATDPGGADGTVWVKP